jgi:hypothetical protein
MNSEWTAPEVTEMTLEEVAEHVKVDAVFATASPGCTSPCQDYG